MAAFLLAFSFIGFVKGLLMFLAILSSIVLIVIVLLQEPKGGGLASAFGGMGAETFGVKTGGVNKFTSIVAGIFMVAAILYASIREEGERSVLETAPQTATEQVPFSGGDLPIVPSSDGAGGSEKAPPGDTDAGDAGKGATDSAPANADAGDAGATDSGGAGTDTGAGGSETSGAGTGSGETDTGSGDSGTGGSGTGDSGTGDSGTGGSGTGGSGTGG